MNDVTLPAPREVRTGPPPSPDRSGRSASRALHREIPLGGSVLGLIGAVVALLAAVWLMYAPFLLGYQPEGASWANATLSDFWTGFGLGVVAVIALIVLSLGLIGALRARGALPTTRPSRPLSQPPAAPSTDDLSVLLRPLMEALARDNAARASSSPLPPTADHAASGSPAR